MTSREAAEGMGQDTAHDAARDRVRNGPTVLADAALAEFVTEHYDRLIRLARLVCRDGGDAGDAVQRGLERAWTSRASLRDLARLRPWVDRIVVREAIRIGRSHQSLVGRFFSPSSQVAWIEPAGPGIDHASEWGAFRTAYAGLSAEHRAVIALHLYAGYSIAETADLVGAPVETVRSRLRLAKDRLRRELQERET
jgi:RNA polymerase sigma-70 factor (ECF subfamily)